MSDNRRFNEETRKWEYREAAFGVWIEDDDQNVPKEKEKPKRDLGVMYGSKPGPANERGASFRKMSVIYADACDKINEIIGSLSTFDNHKQGARHLVSSVLWHKAELDRNNVTDGWIKKRGHKTLKEVAVLGMTDKYKWTQEEALRFFDDTSQAQPQPPAIPVSDKTIMERGINMLMIGQDPKLMWIIDCMSQAMYNQLKKDKALQDWSKDDLVAVIKSGEKFDSIFGYSFTDRDFRKWIGRNMSGWEIRDLFKEVTKLSLKLGKTRVLYEGKHWQELIDWEAYFVQMHAITREGTTTGRDNIPKDHAQKFSYLFRLGFVFEAMMMSNYKKKQLKLLLRKVYKMNLIAQAIYRYFKLFENCPEGCRLSYQMLRSWPCMGTEKNPTNFLSKIARTLADLEAAELLRVDKVEGRGKKTVFVLRKPLKKLAEAKEVGPGNHGIRSGKPWDSPLVILVFYRSSYKDR